MDSRLSGWRAVLILVTFLLTNLIVVFPFRIHVPDSFARLCRATFVKARILARRNLAAALREERQWSISVNYANLPVVAVLFLLATTAVDGSVVRKGIVGTEGIHPLDIMALFISLAYLAISLDATGLLRFLAFWVAKRAGTSGRKLYIYLYAFFFTSGVVIGNDPVVLSGTAFLAYLTEMTGIVPPTAWTFAQFSAANVASAVLVSSNPTNLVISGAFSIPYFVYSAYMILPSLFAAIFMFFVIYAQFSFLSARRERRGLRGKLIPETIVLPEGAGLDAAQFLIDKNGAIVGSTLMLATLAVLVGTSPVKPSIPVWRVTMPGAVIMFLRDGWRDWTRRKQVSRTSIGGEVDGEPGHGDENQDMELRNVGVPTSGEEEGREDIPPRNDTVSKKPSPTTLSSSLSSSKPTPKLSSYFTSFTSHLSQTFPTTSHIISSLPLALLPFAFSMFILVQALVTCGWLDIFASWWSALERVCGREGSVVIMTVLGSLLCNVCGTNIGTTILIARILQLSQSQSPTEKPSANPIIYALAFGTNIGAFTFSFSASLAGLLWREILRQKGIHVTRRVFACLNAAIWVTAVVVGSIVLIVQDRVVR